MKRRAPPGDSAPLLGDSAPHLAIFSLPGVSAPPRPPRGQKASRTPPPAALSGAGACATDAACALLPASAGAHPIPFIDKYTPAGPLFMAFLLGTTEGNERLQGRPATAAPCNHDALNCCGTSPVSWLDAGDGHDLLRAILLPLIEFYDPAWERLAPPPGGAGVSFLSSSSTVGSPELYGSKTGSVKFGAEEGTLWVVDSEHNAVDQRRVSDGALLRNITGMGHEWGRTRLQGPAGLAVSRLGGGGIFISEPFHCRVSQFDQASGQHVFDFAIPRLGSPRGMCLSPDEKCLAVADSSMGTVHLVDVAKARENVPDEWGWCRRVGRRGWGNSCLQNPFDVAFSGRNGKHLVVADHGNFRIQVLRAADGAFVSTLLSADWGDDVHSGDAHENSVRGLCVDNQGNIVCIDSHSVRVFGADYGQHPIHDNVTDGLAIKNKSIGGVCVEPRTGRLAVKSRAGLRILQ